MTRYWLNLKTLRHRINDLEYGVARVDAEKWLGPDVGWFSSIEAMNVYLLDQVIPVLRAAWIANPHQRLGQLISNVTEGDIYYVPDGELRDGLKRCISQPL